LIVNVNSTKTIEIQGEPLWLSGKVME
jgi:hypothetical protein